MEKEEIVEWLKRNLPQSVYAAAIFGSFTKASSFRDVDLLLVLESVDIKVIEELRKKFVERFLIPLDITFSTKEGFARKALSANPLLLGINSIIPLKNERFLRYWIDVARKKGKGKIVLARGKVLWKG